VAFALVRLQQVVFGWTKMSSRKVVLLGVAGWLSLSVAHAQTEAQAWALGAVAEAVIAVEKCPLLRYNTMAGMLLLRAARISPYKEPHRSMLQRRIIGERFTWDTNPDPFACEVPQLRRMGLVQATSRN
jgi:hypothetical protein